MSNPIKNPILFDKLTINATLTCITGLHIGDSDDKADIGGVDNLIVRNITDNTPYIPGSSLKGKIRSLLEQVRGLNGDGGFKADSEGIAALFGATTQQSGEEGLPSRVIFRDAFMAPSSKDKLEKLNKKRLTDLPYTEVKVENTINRVTGAAKHPRKQERIPAGTDFCVEIVLNVVIEKNTEEEQTPKKKKAQDKIRTQLDLLKEGMIALEKDYLGGSGSRGYGQVQFKDIRISPWKNTYDWNGEEINPLTDLQDKFESASK